MPNGFTVGVHPQVCKPLSLEGEGLGRRRCLQYERLPLHAQAASICTVRPHSSKLVKRLLSDSASVGCAKTASRSTV